MAAAANEEMDSLIARFMDVTMCDNRDAAASHLVSCNGSIEDAVGLYFAATAAELDEEEAPPAVRLPIPTRTERLIDHTYPNASSAPVVRTPLPPPIVRPRARAVRPLDGNYLSAVLGTTAPPTPAPVPVAVEATTGLGENTDTIPFPADEAEYPALAAAQVVEDQEEEDVALEEDEPLAEGEAACSVRVVFPDGRVAEKAFGAGRPVTELFRYCDSSVGGSRRRRRAFRLVRFTGAASGEIRRGDGAATFEELGLHLWTLHVLFGLWSRAPERAIE